MLMKKFYTICVCMGMYFTSTAQETSTVKKVIDSLQQVHVKFISDSISINKEKAEQVILILDSTRRPFIK